MICWMFPGQPLKFVPVPVDDADFLELAALCRTKAGFDLMSAESDVTGMALHTRLQIHGTAMSLWRARKLGASGGCPDIVTQHSMGVYPALAICGTISEGDALEMVARVGECMALVFRADEYALGCVIGMEHARLEPIVAGHGVYFANFNTSKHFLISGLKADVWAVLDAASLAGAFSASLHTCDAPLHAPLMAQASTALREIFSDYRYAVPHIPLMSHRGELLEDPSHIRDFLHDELLQPVFWEKSWHALRESGVDRFVEVGVGDTLKKFNRWFESEQITK